jgi:hypothetical protein
MSETIALDAVATVFAVHPRTILRAVSGDYYVYWNEEDRDELVAKPVDLTAVAKVYDTDTGTLKRCILGKDRLVRPDEAAQILEIKPRTFRDRVKKGVYHKIGKGGVARYLFSEIIDDKVSRIKLED